MASKINENSKRKKFKEIFFKWSQNVDINCYQKMLHYGPNNFKIQFIWLFILLGSTGGTFYFISKSIIDYLSYDVVSQTNIVNEIPTQFPTVTFCDNNPFLTSESQSFMELTSKQNNLSTSSWSNVLILTKLHATSTLVTDIQRKTFGLEKNQIIECSFSNRECKNDLNWYWSWEYGNCWQFNSGLNLTNQKGEFKSSTRNGKNFGLKVTLFLYNKNNLISSLENGLVVFVHNSSFRPSQEVFIKPGEMTDIQIVRTFIQKQAQPYSDCIDLTSYSSELYDYIINTGQTYRQQDCFELCLQKNTLKNCNCYFPGVQNLRTTFGPCLNMTDWTCLSSQYYNFNLDDCQTNYCPLECDSIKYDLTLSSLVFPSEGYYENALDKNETRLLVKSILNQSLSYELFKSSFISFRIYYPNLQYALLTESPKLSIGDLFSQIGGSLGLFVSFSIFTLFELFELLILFIWGILFARNRNIDV
jgi:hypothetical protein